MLSSFEQAFVGRDEIRAPLKTPASEATLKQARLIMHVLFSAAVTVPVPVH